MPKAVEDCVEEILADPDFQPELKEGEDRKSAAYAICTARMKESDGEEEKEEMLESTQTIKRLLQFEAQALDDTGSDWRIRIINAGTSKNKKAPVNRPIISLITPRILVVILFPYD